MFCTYLTVYKGNKLPPFYIGSTSVDKIHAGYNGSVSSNQYKEVWKSERTKNKNLFKTTIIKEFPTHEEASRHELKLHLALDVMHNPLYANRAIAAKCFYSGAKHSEETKQRMSQSHKGKKKPPRSSEHCRKLSEASKNKTTSEETKKKLSKAMTGRIMTDEHKSRLSSSAQNRIYDEVWGKMISERLKGVKKSDEGRANIAKGNIGKNKGKIGLWDIETKKQKKFWPHELELIDMAKYVTKKALL